jgi:hypothetical protein
MAKPPVKPDRDSASDADWQMARHREDALMVLLETSSPAAVAVLPPWCIDCWLYTVATHRPVPFNPIAAAVACAEASWQ